VENIKIKGDLIMAKDEFSRLRSIYAKLDFQIVKKEKENKDKSKKNEKAVKKG
jgi:hypothetical protein